MDGYGDLRLVGQISFAASMPLKNDVGYFALTKDKSPPATDFRKTRWSLRAMGVVWGLAVIPSLPAAMMSPMIIAAPGASESPLSVLFMYISISFPLLLLVACIACWWLARAKHLGEFRRRAILCAFSPILIYITPLILIAGLCGGRFVCKI